MTNWLMRGDGPDRRVTRGDGRWHAALLAGFMLVMLAAASGAEEAVSFQGELRAGKEADTQDLLDEDG